MHAETPAKCSHPSSCASRENMWPSSYGCSCKVHLHVSALFAAVVTRRGFNLKKKEAYLWIRLIDSCCLQCLLVVLGLVIKDQEW